MFKSIIKSVLLYYTKTLLLQNGLEVSCNPMGLKDYDYESIYISYPLINFNNIYVYCQVSINDQCIIIL